LNVSALDIKNNTSSTGKAGGIAILGKVTTSGNFNISNGNTVENSKGRISLGSESHSVGGSLVINNGNNNIINGGGDSSNETGAKFDVSGDVTISNEGHLNVCISAGGKITIAKNTA